MCLFSDVALLATNMWLNAIRKIGTFSHLPLTHVAKIIIFFPQYRTALWIFVYLIVDAVVEIQRDPNWTFVYLLVDDVVENRRGPASSRLGFSFPGKEKKKSTGHFSFPFLLKKSNPKKHQFPSETMTTSFSVTEDENELLWVVVIESCGQVGVSCRLL
jgi:hypothetical protein